MGTSTSTGTLAAGNSRTFNLAPASAVTLTTLPNCRVTVTETPSLVTASGVGGNASRTHLLQLAQTVTYGPYPMGGVVVVANAADSGSTVSWSQVGAIFSPGGGLVSPFSYPPQLKLSNLAPKPVGFNYYSLVYEILLSTVAATATTRNAQLAYIQATGANMVRIALPCFSSAEYLTLVHSTSAMPSTMETSNLRSTYIAALDAAFDAAESYGLKLHICDSWGQSFLPIALGETLAAGYDSTSTKTAVYMESAARWLFENYADHPAFGVYSIGNEYATDAAGTTGPTPAQLGAFFTFIADAAREVDPSKIITADIMPPAASLLSTKTTPDTSATTFATLYEGLDAWCIHFYSDSFNFVGRAVAEASGNFPNTSATTLGYEGAIALVEAYRAMADAQGKPFIVGEFGVSTANEADATSTKKARFLRAVSAYADYALWWNVQDATLAAAAGQSTWFITPATTRGTTFSDLTTLANRTKPDRSRKAGGVASLRKQLQPATSMTSTRSVGAFCSVTATAAQGATNYGVGFWLKLNATLTAFEFFADFRDGGNTAGFALVGDSGAGTGIYAEFRGASGNAGNTSGEFPTLVVGEWNHFWINWEACNASTVITMWLNGLYWEQKVTTSALAAIPNTTVCEFLGQTSGAPVAMQDLAICANASPEEIWRHMRGEVLPQSLLHVRALPNGSIVDLGVSRLTVTVGSGVTVVNE